MYDCYKRHDWKNTREMKRNTKNIMKNRKKEQGSFVKKKIEKKHGWFRN